MPPTTAPAEVKSALHHLGIHRSPTQREIALPQDLSYDDAIKALKLKAEEEEMPVDVLERIDAFPFDGALAFMEAMRQVYGWAQPVPTPGFFGDKPPEMLDVKVNFETHEKVIWGRFEIPGMSGYLETGADWDAEPPMFLIVGKVKKKHEHKVRELAEVTRKVVKEKSIYKGKAILLKSDEDGDLQYTDPTGLDFLNLQNVNSAELVLPAPVQAIVTASLFVPIEQTEHCRSNRIPLKRGLLLEGPYGCGKTLTAFVSAKKCVENGWTFIYLDRVAGLQDALLFARRYQPCVIFAEDIDRAMSGGRTVEVDDILNTIDGIEAKSSEIITILTTNHVENINRAMLRPGRLDAIISVTPPDAEAVQRLIRQYGRGLVPADEDLSEVGQAMAGNIPAVVREVVERAKLFSLSHRPGETILLTAKDLLAAADSLKAHLALMAEKPKEPFDERHARVGLAMVEAVSLGLNGTKEGVARADGNSHEAKQYAASAARRAEQASDKAGEILAVLEKMKK